VDFNSLAGELDVDMSHLQNFVKAWYLPTDTIAIAGIRPSKNRQGVLSMPMEVKDLMAFTSEDIWGLAKRSNGDIYGTYITLYPVKDAAKVKGGKRGDKSNVGDVYGVFIDFDVKPGSFESREDVIRFLTEGDIPKPTILVDNGGSGGMHGYWRVNWDEVGYEELLVRWWAFVQSKSEVKIDRLIDSTRLSRMPSSVYWPKEGTEDGKPGTVTIVWADGPQYSVQELEELTEEAYNTRKERISRTVAEHTRQRLSASEIAAELGVGGLQNQWSLYAAIATLEENFNELYTWADILQPLGWTFLKTDSQGREEYARPGRMEKSATVNWPESPDVMSLLSESEETGLAHLKEAGVVLTKFQVALTLYWNGDTKRMAIDIVNQMNGVVDAEEA
jgi:hypothetical protein